MAGIDVVTYALCKKQGGGSGGGSAPYIVGASFDTNTNHLIFRMSNGKTIDSGELPVGGSTYTFDYNKTDHKITITDANGNKQYIEDVASVDDVQSPAKIDSAVIDNDYHLVLTLDDGDVIDCGEMPFIFGGKYTIDFDTTTKELVFTDWLGVEQRLDISAVGSGSSVSKVSELANDSGYQTKSEVAATVAEEVGKLINGASVDYDTFKEIEDWIKANAPATGQPIASSIATINAALNGNTLGTSVPPDAVFTDTVYDDTDLQNKVDGKADVDDIPNAVTDTAVDDMLNDLFA